MPRCKIQVGSKDDKFEIQMGIGCYQSLKAPSVAAQRQQNLRDLQKFANMASASASKGIIVLATDNSQVRPDQNRFTACAVST